MKHVYRGHITESSRYVLIHDRVSFHNISCEDLEPGRMYASMCIGFSILWNVSNMPFSQNFIRYSRGFLIALVNMIKTPITLMSLVASFHKWPVTREMFPFDDIILCQEIPPCSHPRVTETLACSNKMVSDLISRANISFILLGMGFCSFKFVVFWSLSKWLKCTPDIPRYIFFKVLAFLLLHCVQYWLMFDRDILRG